MIAYFLRRLWQMIPTLAGVILLLFILFTLVAGDPAQILAGKMPNPARIAAIRAQLGLDEPVWVQLWLFVKQVATLDFGRSWSTNEPVMQMLANRMPVSLTIMLPVWLFDALIAVTLALMVARVRGALTDRAVMTICTVSMSVSLLLYAVIGQYLLAYRFEWFPVMGWGEGVLDNLGRYAQLPILLILAVSTAFSLRLYRSFIIEELGRDYVRTARAKGAGEGRVLLVHVLRNAAIPIATNLAMAIPGLVVGSFIIEQLFAIPGVGREIITAVDRSDFPVIKAVTILLALLTMAANLLVDLLYHWLDPRVEFK